MKVKYVIEEHQSYNVPSHPSYLKLLLKFILLSHIFGGALLALLVMFSSPVSFVDQLIPQMHQRVALQVSFSQCSTTGAHQALESQIGQ